jgi:hypothetical protein
VPCVESDVDDSAVGNERDLPEPDDRRAMVEIRAVPVV